jgi:hypothetical protein
MGGQQSTELDFSQLHGRTESRNNSGRNLTQPLTADNIRSHDIVMNLIHVKENDTGVPRRLRRLKVLVGGDGLLDFSKGPAGETVSLPDYTFVHDEAPLSARSCPDLRNFPVSISTELLNNGKYCF